MDFQTIAIVLVIVLLLVYLFRRNQSLPSNRSNTAQGSERPTYDDRNVQGQGSFGRNQSSNSYSSQASPRDNDPNIQGQGSLGHNESSQTLSDNRERSNSDTRERISGSDAPGGGSNSERNRGSEQAGNLRRMIDDEDTQERSTRRDNPDIQGSGSFGKDKP